MNIEHLPACCAVQVVSGIAALTPEEALKRICAVLAGESRDGYSYPPRYTSPGENITTTSPMIVFTGVEKCDRFAEGAESLGYASRLADYIKSHDLGAVSGETGENAYYHGKGHMTSCWVWVINGANLQTWWAAHRAEYLKKPSASSRAPLPVGAARENGCCCGQPGHRNPCDSCPVHLGGGRHV